MFDWDQANTAHIARHGVLPHEAEEVVRSNPLDLEQQDRHGESRTAQIGRTTAGRILVIVTTLRNQKIRVVTAFPANREYRNFYKAQKASSSDARKNAP